MASSQILSQDDKVDLSANQTTSFLLNQWSDYFEKTQLPTYFNEKDPLHSMVASLYQLFQSNVSLYQKKKHPLFMEIFIDIQNLLRSINCDSYEQFKYDPQSWISAIGLSMHNILQQKVIVRIFNTPENTTIREIKSHDIAHFTTIKGVILSVSQIKLLVLKIKFVCHSCKDARWINLVDGVYQTPKSCSNDKCKNSQFQIDRNEVCTTLYQRIKIQEIDKNENQIQNVGRQALTIEVELRDNLASKFISGDFVLVNGIIRTEQEENKGQQKGFNGIYIKYILASSVFELSNDVEEFQNQEDKTFTNDEISYINKLAAKNVLFHSLINSFCPTIYGHELVKAGILLSMIGGSNMKFECRSNCHCLMIGDPGQGKSQLLKFASLIAPKSFYISGTGTSTCGLTCSVSRKDEEGSTIDAGALVLADNGVCCIDEFDKMTNEHSALLEAMEQQSVSLAKSGILCSFQARTSIIATANPTAGHYQKNKSFLDNLKIQNSILSRFDLIFLMLDEPDPLRDQKLSEHILSVNKFYISLIKKKFSINSYTITKKEIFLNSNKIKKVKIQSYPYILLIIISFLDGFNDKQQYQSLKERLQNQCGRIEYKINITLIKKIFAHIKANINPLLSKEASKLLQEYYIKLRQQTIIASSTLPITTRQLESLVRLSQARARLDMRDLVTDEHAQLVEESKFECFMDYQNIESQRRNKNAVDKSNVSTLSKPKQTQIFLESLDILAKQNNEYSFSIEQIKEQARKINLQIGEFSVFLESLNMQGYLIQIERGRYQLKYNQ